MASLLPPNSDAYNALVCRDYTKIDQFAEGFRRDVLWERLLNKGRLGISPIVAKDLHARAAMYQMVADELRPTQEPPSNELIEINKKLQDVEKLIKEANGGNGKNVKDAQDALDDLDMNNAFKIVLERARTENIEKIKKIEKEIDAKLMERDAILAVTKGMDREMAVYLWEECVEQGLIPKDDDIGRARLFYAWIAKSIVYRDTIFKMILENDRDMRTLANTIIGGYEVCEGYARLFCSMFDSTTTGKSDNFRAVFISGWGKSNVSVELKSPNTPDVPKEEKWSTAPNHAWNAFPLTTNGNDVTEWKLIDCTWGRIGNTELNGEWFTRSNAEFQRDHRPKIQMHNYGPAPIAQLDFDQRMLVPLFSSARNYFINSLSILPQSFVLPKDWKHNFEFRRTCELIRDPLDGFYVVPGLNYKLNWENAALFVPDANFRTWTAKINLPLLFFRGDAEIKRIYLVRALKDNHPISLPKKPTKENVEEIVWVAEWKFGN